MKIPLPHVDARGRVKRLVQTITTETVPSIRLALLRQLGLTVNKSLSPADAELIEEICTAQHAHLNSTSPASAGESSLRILFWLTKALVLRSDKHATVLLDRLLTLLAHPTWGQSTARGFTILLSTDDLLSRANHAIIRLLHKQRLFNHCAPLLASRFRATNETTIKPNYLVALAGLLGNVPSEVIKPHLDMLVPLLLQSLDLHGEAVVKTATIQTLSVTIRESPSAIESQVSSLIARLLKSCGSGETTDASKNNNAAAVRLAALESLTLFPLAFRHALLLPYRRQVSNSLLMHVLDDAKRAVRKAGVGCRTAWLRMEAVDEDAEEE